MENSKENIRLNQHVTGLGLGSLSPDKYFLPETKVCPEKVFWQEVFYTQLTLIDNVEECSLHLCIITHLVGLSWLNEKKLLWVNLRFSLLPG